MEGRLFALTANEFSDGREVARGLGMKSDAFQN
jgi:hypothetical protein